MKKIAFTVSILTILISIMIGAFFPLMRISNVSQTVLSSYLFIDPGHGGFDGGASGEGIIEAEINMNISAELFEIAKNEGNLVLLTRTGDYDLSSPSSKNHKFEDLKKRVDYINKSGVNTVISIHLNAISDKSIFGPMVYYRENDENSRHLAQAIQDELNITANVKKIIHEENYYIFKKTHVPAILIECGFLSNEKERKSLLQSSYQRDLAKAIYRGFKNYWLAS